ncbi:MAG: malate dehydrogenase [Paludibacteraceae bacterium]|nr:malate dehydrogenase [Candidatus Physcocola equi]MCQ2233250.1 malate dehydrogenase [Paludibacteraceae bacterium]
MSFLTNKKLVIVGAAGAIGSTMAQLAAVKGLSNNIALYDPYLKGLEGVYEELRHCGFEGVNFTFTDNVEEALTGASFIISSGGAPRKEGMTREDLLKGNAQIAADFGDNVKKYCPKCEHIVVIFNPADVTGLVVLVKSGLKPNQVTTLAGLDSTRLQSELAKYFNVPQYAVSGCATLGGHGEKMVPVTSDVMVMGKPLSKYNIPADKFEEIKQKTIQGGSNIIALRGRSSNLSPAYVAVEMIEAAMGGKKFTLPAGCFVKDGMYGYKNVCMAMKSVIDENGVSYEEANLSADEKKALDASYEHLCKMRDEVIGMGVLPAVADWKKFNSNL